MKRLLLSLCLLFSVATAAAQQDSTATVTDFGITDIISLSAEDYINIKLPPLQALLDNARNTPSVQAADAAIDIEKRELKSVRREWLSYFKIVGSYNYGFTDIYNQNFIDNGIPTWTNTYAGQKQNFWNIGGSVGVPFNAILNRRNRNQQQKKRIEEAEYNLEINYNEVKMKIVALYATAIEKLSVLPTATKSMTIAKAQYVMAEQEFINGKLSAQELSHQNGYTITAVREYEQLRSTLTTALLQLEILSNTPIISRYPTNKTK